MTGGTLPLRNIEALRPATEGRIAGADLLCWSVLALGFVNVWRIQALVPVLSLIRPGLLLIGLTVFAWFQANDEWRRWPRMKLLPLVRLMLLFFGIVLLGIPTGAYQGKALMYVQDAYMGTLLYFFFTVAAIRARRDVERILLFHLIGATIFTTFVLLRFEVDASGRLSRLVVYDANDAAFLMVCVMPLAVYFMRKGVSPFLRAAMIAAFIGFTVLLVRSGSRGGFLGFLATMLFLLVRFKGIPFRMRAIALLLGAGTIFAAGTDKYWEMMGTILNPKEDYNYTEAGGRRQIWQRGIGYMLQYPIAGVGLDNFGAAEGQSAHNKERVAEGKGWVWAAPHNSFVQVGAETGVIGLGLFLAMLGLALRYTLATRRRGSPADEDGWALRRALAGSLVAYCVAGFFLSQGYSPFLYSVLGIVAGLTKLDAAGRVARAPAAAPRPARPVLARRV